MLKTINIYLSDFIKLFYPVNCFSCGKNLVKQENCICSECLYLLPKTNFHHVKENPVSQIFWGRSKIETATANYFFIKEGILQKLIHHLKYKGIKEIGYVLGKQMGADLAKVNAFNEIDFVVPVPLHPKRERDRGYNQSEWIAKGIAEMLKTTISINNLFRSVETSTQTKKNRFERWENVENIFSIRNISEFENSHVLLVDDVITTGSTLEACANTLLEIKNIKVSIGALGFTS